MGGLGRMHALGVTHRVGSLSLMAVAWHLRLL